MSKIRTKKFNFNSVVDLYREWKIEEWCTELYENIWIFIDSCNTIRVLPQDRDNVMNEAILEAHMWILKSLDREYAQIYNYVKLLVTSAIKKLYTKESIFNLRYHTIDINNLDEIIESTIWNKISDKTTLEFLIKWILTLSENERNVIYLRVFNFPDKTLNEIAIIANTDKKLLSRVFRRAIRKIKKYLSINLIDYENLF